MKRTILCKKTLSIVAVAIVLIQLVSCKKFLQVQPRDYMFEKEAFATEKGVESALNGIYQIMANPQIYGNVLTVNVTEQMAQYYYASSLTSGNQAYIKDFNYANTFVKPIYADVWRFGYRTILNVNNFCERLNGTAFNVLPNDKRGILLGEAYGLRAFLHFDQLRLFGPVYAKSPEAKAIPYVKKANAEIQPLLPANVVLDNIMKDLDSALIFLEKDPVRTTGANRTSTTTAGGSVDYMSNRHRRMNYFAVKTLAARVLLYAGRKAEAWAMASSIIEAQEAFFPWSKEAELASDPLMSKESFFGIENKRIYDTYRELFSPLLKDDMIFTVQATRLNGLYSPTSTDLRLKYWFKIGTEGEKAYKVIIKHSNVTIKDASLMYYQPLIRKSELYLIAAETAPVLADGFSYLNKQRLAKGLAPIPYEAGRNDILLNGIRDEYQREFIGEGQTFFMFKRLNLASITAVSGSGTVSMNDAKYVVPLPEDENFYR